MSLAIHATLCCLSSLDRSVLPICDSDFSRAMLCKSAAYAVVRCPSVTFVYSIEINKRISSNIFSSSGIAIILVFRTKRYGNIPTGIPLTEAKIAIFDQYLA